MLAELFLLTYGSTHYIEQTLTVNCCSPYNYTACGAVYCNRSCLFVCGCVCLFVCVCGSVTTITRNCVIDPHQTGFVGKGSDHLQLIKFWPSRAPGNGVCGGAKMFDWLRLTTASAQCLRLSERFLCGPPP